MHAIYSWFKLLVIYACCDWLIPHGFTETESVLQLGNNYDIVQFGV